MALFILISSASDAFHRFARADTGNDFEERIHPLAFDDDIDAIGGERLIGQERRMPATEDNRFIRITKLDGPRYPYRLANHRARYQGHGEAQRVLHFVDDGLLEVRGDGGIDQPHLVSGAQQRGGEGEDTEGSRRLLARDGGKEED